LFFYKKSGNYRTIVYKFYIYNIEKRIIISKYSKIMNFDYCLYSVSYQKNKTKIMKTLKTILVMFLLLIAFNMNAQTEKSLIKTFDDSNPIVIINLPGEIETKSWSGDHIKIIAKISSDKIHIINSLISAGRYDMTSISENGRQIISMPKSSKKVTIKGDTFEENFKFEILLPYGVVVEKDNTLLK
jgi:hypothetical protein